MVLCSNSFNLCLIIISYTIFAAEAFGFTSYQPPYLSLRVKGNNILNGANFASAGSGYHDSTAKLYVSYI